MPPKKVSVKKKPTVVSKKVEPETTITEPKATPTNVKAKPKSDPVPTNVKAKPKPDPEPEPVPQNQEPVEAEPLDDEDEMALHPQLEELLMYLADTDRVNIVNEVLLQNMQKMLETITTNITMMQNKINLIEDKLNTEQVKTVAATPQVPTVATTLQVPTVAATPQVKTTLKGIEAIFVVNKPKTNNGEKLAEGLRKNNHSANVHVVQSLSDINTDGISRFLVINDSVLIHRSLNKVWDMIYNNLHSVSEASTGAMVLCSTEHPYFMIKPELDEAFYRTINYDVDLGTTEQIKQHWRTEANQKGIPSSVIYQIATTTRTPHAMYFANTKAWAVVQENIRSNSPTPLKIPGTKIMIPNLFIQRNVGSMLCKRFMWYQPHYITY